MERIVGAVRVEAEECWGKAKKSWNGDSLRETGQTSDAREFRSKRSPQLLHSSSAVYVPLAAGFLYLAPISPHQHKDLGLLYTKAHQLHLQVLSEL